MDGDDTHSLRQAFSPAEFAALSGLSLATVRRYLASGRLPKVQPFGRGGRVMIPASALSPTVAKTPQAAGQSTSEEPMPARRHGPRPRWTQ